MRHRLILAAALGAAIVTLGACSNAGQAGSAATVGDQQITSDYLAQTVDAVQSQQGVVPGEPDPELVVNVLQRLIVTDLVQQVADKLGVTVTQAQVDTSLADLEAQLGGPEGVQQAFLDSGVPSDQIEEQVRLSLLVQAIGLALVPDSDAAGQQQAVVQYVTGFGLERGIVVSPRFGTWDPLTLQIGAAPDDLSAPLDDIVPVS